MHAIGKGILIAEIQQNSNVTYRVYDYGRVGKDGRRRDLHIEKALAVTNTLPIVKKGSGYPHVADCDYFTVDKLFLDGNLTYRMQGTVYDTSFLSILILDGEGTISNKGEKVTYRKGDSLFLPAGCGDWQIEGRCDALLTTIREKASPVRAGVNIGAGCGDWQIEGRCDALLTTIREKASPVRAGVNIGSSEIRIGLVGDRNELIAHRRYSIDLKKTPLEIISETAINTLDLLKENDVPLDQCIGVGVGVPGTIDRREGKVIYSNNLRWEDVPLAVEFGKVVPCPVRIANDADCAALGEAAAGAGKDVSDLVMFTLGNGVGGGIILKGEIFEGGIMGGSEVGHQVIRVNGRRCSCGRKGCLEAYVSMPALIRSASQAAGRELEIREIFENAEEGDIVMQEVLEQYTQMLGQGIVNIVNMFRPQMIILGGLVSEYADILRDPIMRMISEDTFGGNLGKLPELRTSVLGSDAGMIGAANL